MKNARLIGNGCIRIVYIVDEERALKSPRPALVAEVPRLRNIGRTALRLDLQPAVLTVRHLDRILGEARQLGKDLVLRLRINHIDTKRKEHAADLVQRIEGMFHHRIQRLTQHLLPLLGILLQIKWQWTKHNSHLRPYNVPIYRIIIAITRLFFNMAHTHKNRVIQRKTGASSNNPIEVSLPRQTLMSCYKKPSSHTKKE